MFLRPRWEEKRLGWPRYVVWTIGVALCALFAGIGAEVFLTWRAYNQSFGAKTASNDWINRRLTSYSVDTYEELLAIWRLQLHSQRYASGAIDKEEYSIQRRQVVGAFDTFRPGTVIEKEVSTHEAYPEAYKAATAFLAAAAEFEAGKRPIEDVYAAGQEAINNWAALASQVFMRELEQRDGMENAIVEFRPLAVRSFAVISVMVAFCAAAIAAAIYAAWRAWAAERSRFDRLELILSTVGHDLRSPLQALIGAAKLAAEDASPQERQKFVNIVHERSAFFTRLVDDMIDLARSASLSFIPVHLDVAPWFAAASARYKMAAKEKGLEFTSKLDSDMDAILFDAHRLSQTADNLVFNAIHYTDKGGVTLVVRLRRTQPQNDTHALLELEVADTGVGISSTDRKRIFEPFVRVDQDTQGLGLGLSMVLALAKRVGGSAEVLRSSPGAGSTFLFRAPVAASENPIESQPPMSLTWDNKKTSSVAVPRVLLVDDDKVITQVMAGLLPHMGYHADIALGGREGLRMALSGDYCAILTDIQMPELDGFELAKTVRKVLKHCPTIIALTAYSSRRAVVEQAGIFDTVLRKPFEPLALAEHLDVAAGRWETVARDLADA
jgi:signal transduction histidine kinase